MYRTPNPLYTVYRTAETENSFYEWNDLEKGKL